MRRRGIHSYFLFTVLSCCCCSIILSRLHCSLLSFFNAHSSTSQTWYVLFPVVVFSSSSLCYDGHIARRMRSVVQFMPRLASKNIARARGNRRDLLLSAFFPKKGAKSGVSRRTARAAAQEGSRRLVLSFYNGSIALQRRILSRYERSVNRVACPSRGSISSLGFFARSPLCLVVFGVRRSRFSPPGPRLAELA